jgi:hypothetical protein
MIAACALKRVNLSEGIRMAGWGMIAMAAILTFFPGFNDVIIRFLE